jgi:hypothetical protein
VGDPAVQRLLRLVGSFILPEAPYDLNYPSFIPVAGSCSCSGRGDRPSRLGRIRHVQVVRRHGEILKSTYENPHCEIEIEVHGKHWRFILAPPSRMQHRGITPDIIAPGKTCTVFGYPHTSNPDEARIEYIILDGKRIELR